MDISKYIKNNHLKVIIKPNSAENKILGYDENKEALKVTVTALPEKGKANQAVVKFFSKLLKKRVIINSGLKSREKTLLISSD